MEDADRTECLGQIEVNPAMSRSQREQLGWCTGGDIDDGTAEVVWDLCPEGCCVRLARVPDQETARLALQEVVEAVAEAGLRCAGVIVVRRGDGEMFVLRVTRGRAYAKRLTAAAPERPRLAAVIPLRTRRGDQRVRV